jgi:hypothetical protein
VSASATASDHDLLFSKNAVFLAEIFDDLVLVLIHPAADRDDKK